MAMTLRERLLTGLRGGKPDRIPWSIYAWLLPETPAAHELHAKGLGLMGAATLTVRLRSTALFACPGCCVNVAD